jgi:thioesterase domain-containing protein
MPGNHFTMIQEPHVRVLAERLELCLHQAQTMRTPAGLPLKERCD